MLTDSQYNTIARIYDSRRSAAMRLKDSRTNELYNADPAIKEIDDELRSGSVNAGIMALKGEPSALNELRTRNELLIQKKKKLIQTAGFPENYTEDVYYCPLCRDTGKTSEGRCGCYTKTIIEEFFLTEERRELLERENFNTINSSLYSKERIDKESGLSDYAIAGNSILSALNFSEGFGKEFQNLLITGEAGTGKTFLANCIAKKLVDNGISVLYLSAIDFFELCKKYRLAGHDDMKEAETEMNFVINAECLILDDLGAETSSASTNSQLFNCIEKRFLRKHPTVITTNLSKEDIAVRYSDRIRSRLLANYRYLKMPGDDNRMKAGI